MGESLAVSPAAEPRAHRGCGTRPQHIVRVAGDSPALLRIPLSPHRVPPALSPVPPSDLRPPAKALPNAVAPPELIRFLLLFNSLWSQPRNSQLLPKASSHPQLLSSSGTGRFDSIRSRQRIIRVIHTAALRSQRTETLHWPSRRAEETPCFTVLPLAGLYLAFFLFSFF